MRKIILLIFSLIFFTCEIVNIDYLKPIIITYQPTSILTNSVVLSGQVFGEGGKDITEYGAVWSETFPPTIQDNKMVEGERVGYFNKRYEGFKSNTTYYYAAYGINEVGVGYGSVYEFKTNPEPSCNPTINNLINLGNGNISMNNIEFENSSLEFNDGNLQFETKTTGSTLKITLNFNEINGGFPLTGEYLTVSNFDNQSIKSNGEVKLSITDFGFGSLGGGKASEGQKIYIENDGSNNITFIYCNVNVSDKYTLNGKYTYTP